jgi:hypothetical protein
MFAQIPDATIQNIYETKPRRTGAWVLNETGWFYTARPETYRQESEEKLSLPFWKTPDHMQIED